MEIRDDVAGAAARENTSILPEGCVSGQASPSV